MRSATILVIAILFIGALATVPRRRHVVRRQGPGSNPQGPPSGPNPPAGPPPTPEQIVDWVCGNVTDSCQKNGVTSAHDGKATDLCDNDDCHKWLPDHFCFFPCAAQCEGLEGEEGDNCVNQCMTCQGGFEGPNGGNNSQGGDNQGDANTNVNEASSRIGKIATKFRVSARRATVRPVTRKQGPSGPSSQGGNHSGPGPNGPPQGPPPTLEQIVHDVCQNITDGCTAEGAVSANDGKVTDLCDNAHCNTWLPEHLCFFQCVAENCEGLEGQDGEDCGNKCMECQGGPNFGGDSNGHAFGDGNGNGSDESNDQADGNADEESNANEEATSRIIRIVAKSRRVERRAAIRRAAMRAALRRQGNQQGPNPPQPQGGNGQSPPTKEEAVAMICDEITKGCEKEGMASAGDGKITDLCDNAHCQEFLPNHFCTLSCAGACPNDDQACADKCMECQDPPEGEDGVNGDGQDAEGEGDADADADADAEASAERVVRIIATRRVAQRRNIRRRASVRRVRVQRRRVNRRH